MHAYVVLNFLSQLMFVFPLFLGMVMYADEFETKEKKKKTTTHTSIFHRGESVRYIETTTHA